MKQSSPHVTSGEILSKASILVALPQLQDTFFAKSVILLIEHNSSGAFGFVINRPTDVALKELIYLDEKINLNENARVWFGGPVSTNSGIILEYRPDLLAADSLPFNITTKKESLIKMVSKNGGIDTTSDSKTSHANPKLSSEGESPLGASEEEISTLPIKTGHLELSTDFSLAPSQIKAKAANQVLEYIKHETEEQESHIASAHDPAASKTGEASKNITDDAGKSVFAARKVLFPYRFIMGYSGWNQDQLEEELILGNWIQMPFDEELIFNTPVENLWEECFTTLGTCPEAIAPTIQPYLN